MYWGAIALSSSLESNWISAGWIGGACHGTRKAVYTLHATTFYPRRRGLAGQDHDSQQWPRPDRGRLRSRRPRRAHVRPRGADRHLALPVRPVVEQAVLRRDAQGVRLRIGRRSPRAAAPGPQASIGPHGDPRESEAADSGRSVSGGGVGAPPRAQRDPVRLDPPSDAPRLSRLEAGPRALSRARERGGAAPRRGARAARRRASRGAAPRAHRFAALGVPARRLRRVPLAVLRRRVPSSDPRFGAD